MKREFSAKKAMELLEKTDAQIVNDRKSNLYLLAINNLINALGYIVKKQSKPTLDCLAPADLIVSSMLLPKHSTAQHAAYERYWFKRSEKGERRIDSV